VRSGTQTVKLHGSVVIAVLVATKMPQDQ